MLEVKSTLPKAVGCPSTPRQVEGFTLVELMVTIAIATILMMVAVPSYVTFQRNAQLSDAVSNFMSAVNAARGKAIQQGQNTYLVPLDETNWSSGWFVYADVNWDKNYTAGTDELILKSTAPSSALTITTPTDTTPPDNSLASGYFLFNGSGYPKSKTGGLATGKIVMANAHRSSTVNIDGTGRVRSCKVGSIGC